LCHSAHRRKEMLIPDPPPPSHPLSLLYVGTLPPHPGGSAISCGQLLLAFASRDHRVRAISAITDSTRNEGEHFDRAAPGLAVRRFRMAYFETNPAEPTNAEFRERERHAVQALVDEEVQRDRPDMLIAGRELFALHVGPLARKYRIPYCVWVRGGSTQGALLGTLPIDEVKRQFSEIARANLVVVPARHLVDALRGLGVPDPTVIMNAIDLDQFTPEPANSALQASLGISEDQIVIAHVSNLKSIKRPLEFVEAAAATAKAEPRLRFLVVGDGVLLSEMQSAVAAAGLLERFIFTGWVPYDDMPRYIRLADAVVMPSAGEGLARVYLETMACGRVLIASDVAAAAELITHGQNGLLFPVSDVEALSAQIIRVAADPEMRRRIGTAARTRVLPHRLDTAADAYIAAIRSHLDSQA
jgi:glycosyltransferase involved in cell wall biosynthesis